MAKIIEVVDDGTPVSIQGEQMAASGTHYASDDEVDAWVRAASAGAVKCRQRGRHDFPTIEEAGMRFGDVTALGLLVRRVLCGSCLVVERVEEWDVRHKGDRVTRTELVRATLDYLDPEYLAKPGTGRMIPKAVRNAVASSVLSGESFRGVLEAAKAARKRREGS